MSAPISVKPPQADSSRQEKEEAIKALETDEGGRRFMGEFERKLIGYRNLAKRGGRFLLDKELEDMRETADKIREKMPRAAELIDQARKKLERLLEKEKEERG